MGLGWGMSVRIVDFPRAGAPHPFEPAEPQRFLRRDRDGAVSRLYTEDELTDLNRLASYFPVGQCQLWELERVLLQDRRVAPFTSRRWTLQRPPRREEQVYVILGADGSVLGGEAPRREGSLFFREIQAAEAALDSPALARASLVVIALLRGAIYWH